MKMNFGQRVIDAFAAMHTDYDSMNNLMKDVALGREIFDSESGRTISKAEANEKILAFSHQVLGITDPKDHKQVRRALRDNGKDWFDVIEDVVDFRVVTGLQESDWYNELVDMRTINYGDRQDFYLEEDAFLSVAKAGTSHHSHILQRIAGGAPISVPTERYVVKVGADINKYITGQIDWTKLVDKIAEAFSREIQAQIFAEVDTIASKLPVTSGFVDSGVPGAAGTEDDFDEILENVSAANNGAEVVIMGTKSALSKVNKWADVDFVANAQKDNVMNTGNIGLYKGVRLVEIPNRFTDNTFTSKVFNEKKLLVLPVIGEDGKFVKFVDEGETQISEIMDRDSKYTSDIQTYEVQRNFGVAVVLGRQIGQYTITQA